MAFNAFPAAIVGLTALSVISGAVNAHPQKIEFETHQGQFPSEQILSEPQQALFPPQQVQSKPQHAQSKPQQAQFQPQQAQFQPQQTQFQQPQTQFQQPQTQFQQPQTQFQQQEPQFQQQEPQFQQQQVPAQSQYQPISEVCLGCICDSISSCNRTLTCEGDVCGMFRITWAYWADSGKPVLQGDNPSDGLAYARCTNDPSCARQSVVNYLTRFAQDCNRDGVVNCLDYASIHKLGGYGCSAPLDWQYKSKFDACQKSVQELSGSTGTADAPIDLRFGEPKQ